MKIKVGIFRSKEKIWRDLEKCDYEYQAMITSKILPSGHEVHHLWNGSDFVFIKEIETEIEEIK